MDTALVPLILNKLAISTPAVDLAGLTALYRAWCEKVPRDNLLRRVQLAEGGPLPGLTADSFFEDWLATGAGGNCFSNNNALCELLLELGFSATRGFASTYGDSGEVNHGTVSASVDGVIYLVDASAMHGDPIPLDGSDYTDVHTQVRWLNNMPVINWRLLPTGKWVSFYTIRLGATEQEFADRYVEMSNQGIMHVAQLRVRRGAEIVGFSYGRTAVFDTEGNLTNSPMTHSEMIAHSKDLGISADLADRIPVDQLRTDVIS